MKNVQIFIKPTCGFCKKALLVLKRQGVNPDIVDIAANPGRRSEMVNRSGATTVPQIFVAGVHLGDCSRIVHLEKSGQLSEMLK